MEALSENLPNFHEYIPLNQELNIDEAK